MTNDGKLNTKWGRITSQEWFWRRMQEDMDKWLGPEQLHYVLTRTPYLDAHGREIVDHEFRSLLLQDPAAAHAQLEREFNADLIRQREIDIQLAAEREAQKVAIATFVKEASRSKRKRPCSSTNNKRATTHQLPLV
jgi:hypothetical protein